LGVAGPLGLRGAGGRCYISCPSIHTRGTSMAPRTNKAPVGRAAKKRRASSSGGKSIKPVDMSGWRVSVGAPEKIKFDDEAKGIFLSVYSKTNRIGQACEAAGISRFTYARHFDIDPDFAAACEAAKEEWRDRCHETLELVAVTGLNEPIMGKVWDPDIGPVVERLVPAVDAEGAYIKDENDQQVYVKAPVPKGAYKDAVVATKKVYDSRLLALEMKRLDAGYRDGPQVDVNVNTGVLVAPAEISPEDWIARETKAYQDQQAANKKLVEG
jgi:hypothetical protein